MLACKVLRIGSDKEVEREINAFLSSMPLDTLGRTVYRNIPHTHSFEIPYHSLGVGSLSQNSLQTFFMLMCFYPVLP